VKAKEAGRCWWAVGGAASAAGGGSCFAGEANGLQQQQAFRDIFIGGVVYTRGCWNLEGRWEGVAHLAVTWQGLPVGLDTWGLCTPCLYSDTEMHTLDSDADKPVR
jgi:hypothetical protein